jgi:hypothetical protein
MDSSKLWRNLIVTVLLIAGIWLITASPAGPSQEDIVRQRAISALSPAGMRNVIVPEITTQEKALPTVVNLADIPAGVYDPDNQYDRWLRGEIDLEGEDILSDEEIAILQEEALKLAPDNSIQLASQGPGMRAPMANTGFDSIDFTECCGGGGVAPPDPEIAAGPNHLIAVVNVAFEVYDKSGNSLAGPTTFYSFFGALPNCGAAFDPNVLYDEKENRWMIGVDADGTHYCAAVSQTGDPLGSWNIYAFQTGNSSQFFDYPHAGIGEDAIFVGANIFDGSFLESRIYALEKAAMYAGDPAGILTQNLGRYEDTPQPMNAHGWNQGTWPSDLKHYTLTEVRFNGREHTLWVWDGPFSGPNTFGFVGIINLNEATGVTAGYPVKVPQASGHPLKANDLRPLDFEYRNGFGWTTSTISCNPGVGLVNCLRWAQIDLSTGEIGPAGAGVYSSLGDYRFFPDLAVNSCNDMAIGYTKSSTSMWPSIWFTGRESADLPGALQAESELKAGEIEYTSFETVVPRRWGDYTGMTIDPDGQTFWYIGEYSKDTGTTAGRWGTYIGSFTYPECASGGNPPDLTNHVSDLDGSVSSSGRDRWNATVTITVLDSDNTPVADATVDGIWSDGAKGGSECTTDNTGQCTVDKRNLKDSVISVTFTVVDITHASNEYNAGDNNDPDGDSDGTTIIVTKDPPAPPGNVAPMHIGDLDGNSIPAPRGNKWKATVTITVHDESDSPISDVTVMGSWSTRGEGSCTTDGSGQCTVTKTGISANTSSITFSVTGVTHPNGDYGYAPEDNHDPDGDSDGTHITITKPE